MSLIITSLLDSENLTLYRSADMKSKVGFIMLTVAYETLKIIYVGYLSAC